MKSLLIIVFSLTILLLSACSGEQVEEKDEQQGTEQEKDKVNTSIGRKSER